MAVEYWTDLLRSMIYFAYRSDLSPAEMTARCPGYRSVGVGRLPDHRLVFRRFSRINRGATAGFEPHAGEVVWGALYEIPSDELPILHQQEGYAPDGPASLNEAEFRQVTVLRLGGSEAVPAVTYVPVPDGTAVPPSRGYVDLTIQGATFHGLPKAWLVVLQSVRTS